MDRRTRCRVLAASLSAALALGACTIHNRTHSAVERTPEARGARSVCVLFVDGLSTEAFESLLASGALPELKKEVVDRGLSFDTAVASVPSETYPNLSSMLTGLFPGHHGIPANIWLDRRLHRREAHTNIFRNYSASDFLDPFARTLYERLPADTVAITTTIARGATVYSKNMIAVMASYVRNDWRFLDRKTLDDMGDAYAGAVTAGGLPSLVWGHLLGPDEVAHSDGPGSVEFQKTLTAVDRGFARLVRRLKRRKVFERILFVLIGDHGNTSYTKYVDADELVHRALVSHPTAADCASGDCQLVSPPRHGKVAYDVGDALIAVGAYRGVMIWLPATRPPEDVPAVFRNRKGKGRRRRGESNLARTMPPRLEFAAALARLPEIELVVTRGAEEGRVEIYGPAGRSEIVRADFDARPSLYSYRVLDGADPLGYDADPVIRASFGAYSRAGTWLAMTARTAYPDVVVQLAELYDSPRTPDVYISPKAGFGFRAGKAAGHGSLARSEMVVPLVFAGPGVAPGRRPVARTVDLAPTLLRYLGVPFDPDDMDGDDLGIVTFDAPHGAIGTDTGDGEGDD